MKNHYHKRAPFLLAFFTVFLFPALSYSQDAAAVISGLQSKYDSITSIRADFTQEVSSKGMGSQRSVGKVWFKKPGKMRWEYEKPTKDVIVSDGQTLWLYQPDLNQVIEKEASSGSSAMATDFLSGIGDIEKDFDVLLSGADGRDYLLTLTPKEEDPGIRKLALSVDKDTFIVKKTVLTDHFGNKTAVAFRNIKVNQSMKDSLFKFTPPQGATIVRP